MTESFRNEEPSGCVVASKRAVYAINSRTASAEGRGSYAGQRTIGSEAVMLKVIRSSWRRQPRKDFLIFVGRVDFATFRWLIGDPSDALPSAHSSERRRYPGACLQKDDQMAIRVPGREFREGIRR